MTMEPFHLGQVERYLPQEKTHMSLIRRSLINLLISLAMLTTWKSLFISQSTNLSLNHNLNQLNKNQRLNQLIPLSQSLKLSQPNLNLSLLDQLLHLSLLVRYHIPLDQLTHYLLEVVDKFSEKEKTRTLISRSQRPRVLIQTAMSNRHQLWFLNQPLYLDQMLPNQMSTFQTTMVAYRF